MTCTDNKESNQYGYTIIMMTFSLKSRLTRVTRNVAAYSHNV